MHGILPHPNNNNRYDKTKKNPKNLKKFYINVINDFFLFILCSWSFLPIISTFFIVYTWIMTILTPISINTGKTHQWMRLLDPNNVPHYYTTVIILLLCSYYMMLGRWPLLVSHSPPIIFSILASLLLVLHIAFF